MKTQYKKVRKRNDAPGMYVYSREGYGYHRSVRTFTELRERAGVLADDDLREYGIMPRMGRNRNMLDAWNDFHVCRDFGRSWKDYTKHRKQWEVGFDPVIEAPTATGLTARLNHMIYMLSGDEWS